MATTQGKIEAYENDQLVVAIPDLEPVRAALKKRAVVVADQQRNDRLGLALLTLQGVADLDLLIYAVREDFQKAFDGWVPTMGKNRVIEPVRGLPYIGGGGEGDPYLGGNGDPRTSSTSGSGPDAVLPMASPPGWPQRANNSGRDIRVGVLDTRLYPNEWLTGGDEAPASALLQMPTDGSLLPASAGHATFIAGLILRAAPEAQLVIRPVLDANAVGRVWDVAEKMVSFLGSGVNILNLSFGCYTDDGQPPLVLARAVSLLSAELLLVAAAGNHGNIDQLRAENSPLANQAWTKGLTSRTPVWPAAFDQVIAVGATDGDSLASFSPRTPWVNLTAPGVDVESTYLTGEVKLATPTSQGNSTQKFSGTAYWDGTSFAAAAVSGALAATIRPGWPDPRQALESIYASPGYGIRPYPEPSS